MNKASQITYSSTRSLEAEKEHHSFSEAVVKGIADNGGLFVPSALPKLHITSQMTKLSYNALANEIFSLYLTDFTEKEILECVDEAYDDKFDSECIVPIKTFSNVSFVELFHGRTLAFKDMALSILPHFMKTSANKLGITD